MFGITESDVKKAVQINQGWYPVLVDNAYEKPASTDGSKLVVFEGHIIGGEFDGCPLVWQFSEKAPSFAIPFFKALGAPIGEKGTEFEKGGQFDEKRAIGKTIKVFVKNEMYQGRMLNKADQFLSTDAAV
jgi:hypothetical protein